MKKEFPLVSIITVVYNGAKTIQQSIESVKNQTYNNIEYIVIDGESNDNTLLIIKDNLDTISYWNSEPDKGLYDAMNKGIKVAKGELIGIINSDDWYELDAVETMVNAYINYPSKTIFHADRFDIDEKGNKSLRKFNSSTFKFKYYGMTYNHPSMLIKKEEYLSHTYSNKLRSLSDYQFVLEAYISNHTKFLYINKPIVNYRLDGVSAQLSFYDSMKEGFISRRDAGMFIINNLFALLIRSLMSIFFILKKLLNE
jgi:glycosyltransferase involved in cell wall biosynthesis